MKKGEKLDFSIIFIWPIIASIISVFLEETKTVNSNFFLSIIIFLAIPSVYLSIRNRKFVIKALIPALLISCPLMILIEYIGYSSLSWSFPESIFPFKIFGNVIFEVVLWAFFNSYFVVIFYESFLHHHFTKKFYGKRFKYLLIITLVAFSIFCFIGFNKIFVNISYFYLIFGLVLFGLPIAIQFLNYSHTKKLIVKMLKASAYFFYLSFIYEFFALKYNWWGFPGKTYIGWFEIFGVKFPLEELIWWILLFAFAILVYYEYFNDDEE